MDAEYSLVWQKLFEMIRNKFRVYIQAKEQWWFFCFCSYMSISQLWRSHLLAIVFLVDSLLFSNLSMTSHFPLAWGFVLSLLIF
jgi:hypothetical protein